MEVQAHLRNLRMSPRKVRLVIDLVRGKGVDAAVTQLSFLKKDAAQPVLKLLKSAVANAAHNHQLDASGLRIKTITADGGPTLKRYRPRAHGAAAPIRKRTTHLSLTLTDEPAPAGPEKKKPKAYARRRPEAVTASAPEAPAVEEEVKAAPVEEEKPNAEAPVAAEAPAAEEAPAEEPKKEEETPSTN